MGRDGMGWHEVGGEWGGMAGRRREAMAWNARWKRCDGMEREGTMERTCRFFWDVSPRSGLFATSVLSQSAGFSNLLLGRPLTGLMRSAPRASSSFSVVGRAVGRARRADSNRRQVDRQHLDPGQDDLFTVPQAQDHGGEVAVVPGTRDDSANNLTGLLVT